MNEERRAWTVTWIAAPLPLLGWWLYGLFDVDEGFYGAVVAEMNRRGEWITPYYNGHPWFEKPILLYWAAKPFMALFGDTVGPRLPSILATIATYVLVAWFVRRRWGDAAARLSVLVAASSLLIAAVGRMMMTDALLALCVAGCLLFFWESVSPIGKDAAPGRWRMLSALFLGLGVLAKGPVAIVLFAGVAAWTYWREKDLRPAFRGGWIAAGLVFMATVACWYVPAYLANGQVFVQKFLVEQNLNRFTGGDAAHNTPLWSYPFYYPLVLLLGMLPWSVWIFRAWPLRSRDQGPEAATLRFLGTWVLVPLVFFSVSKAKLPHYILPSTIPLAMLVGVHLRSKLKGGSRRQLRGPAIASLALCLLLNLTFVVLYRSALLGGHAEVQRLALAVKDSIRPGEQVAAYQMSKRSRELSTGTLKIQETAHPSIVMLLDRVVVEPGTIEDMLADPSARWILTRSDRIAASDLDVVRRAGRELSQVDTSQRQDLYRLYYLTAQPGARTRRP